MSTDSFPAPPGGLPADDTETDNTPPNHPVSNAPSAGRRTDRDRLPPVPGVDHVPFAAYRPDPLDQPTSFETGPVELAHIELPGRPSAETATFERRAQGEPSPTDRLPVNPGPPALVDDIDRSLDPRWLPLARIGSFIGAGILTLITAGAATAIAFSNPDIWPIVVGIWAFLVLLLWARAWFWPALAYRHTSYRLSPKGLVIRRGVLWRSIAHVPRSRVQHTDVSQGPLERYFELGTLTVHTAGTQFASVSLDGLAHITAEQIRDVLIEAGEGDGV